MALLSPHHLVLAAEFGVGIEEMKLALLKQGDVEIEEP